MKHIMNWINKNLPTVWALLMILFISLLLCAGVFWSLDLVLDMMGRFI